MNNPSRRTLFALSLVMVYLRAHGLDKLVDGYGVHDYPPAVKAGDKAAIAARNVQLDRTIFPPGNAKPYWLTE